MSKSEEDAKHTLGPFLSFKHAFQTPESTKIRSVPGWRGDPSSHVRRVRNSKSVGKSVSNFPGEGVACDNPPPDPFPDGFFSAMHFLTPEDLP